MQPLKVIDNLDRFMTVRGKASITYRQLTRYIVIHHAGATYRPGDACQAIFEYHSRKWPDYGRIGYHVVLQEERDGSISVQIVNPLDSVGAHVGLRNYETVGLCAATSFSSPPTEKWLNAIAFATQELKLRYPNAGVVGHKEIALSQYPTSCPGPFFQTWKPEILRRITTEPLRVIGVAPTVTFGQFWRFLGDRQAPIDYVVAIRVYGFAQWLDVDPAYVAAVWYAEQGSPDHPLGDTEVGRATNNPFNLKAYGKLPSALVKGALWNKFESWQLGLYYSVLHLKQVYGAQGILTVEEITPIFAPRSDGNDPITYIERVRETLKVIQALPR